MGSGAAAAARKDHSQMHLRSPHCAFNPFGASFVPYSLHQPIEIYTTTTGPGRRSGQQLREGRPAAASYTVGAVCADVALHRTVHING